MRSARRHARSRLYLHPGPVSRDHRGNGCGDQRHLTTPGRAMSLHKPGGAASGLPTGESMMVSSGVIFSVVRLVKTTLRQQSAADKLVLITKCKG